MKKSFSYYLILIISWECWKEKEEKGTLEIVIKNKKPHWEEKKKKKLLFSFKSQ